MSLTQELNDPNSPVKSFMASRFPNTRAAVRTPNQSLKSTVTAQPAKGIPLKLVGTAIDYRIRYMFNNPSPANQTAAQLGWQNTLYHATIRKTPAGPYAQVPGAGQGHISIKAVEEFLQLTDQMAHKIQPWLNEHDQVHEAILDRHCLILALLEQNYRTHPSRSSLLHKRDIAHAQDLLDLIPNRWAQELASLAQQTQQVVDCLDASIVIHNPQFAGSKDVNGADADLIADNCLIDFKTTIKPAIQGKWLHQLLSYTLLDYSDDYRISSVGILLPRQAHLVTWPISPLIDVMSDHRHTDVSRQRDDFKNAVQPVKRRSTWKSQPMQATNLPDDPTGPEDCKTTCNCAAPLFDGMEHADTCPASQAA